MTSPATTQAVQAQAALPDKKDELTEATRLRFQFWLIFAALAATVAVAVITLYYFSAHLPPQTTTGDMVAIITAITGIFATLLAGYSGVQAVNAVSRHSAEQMTKQSSLLAKGAQSATDQAPFSTITPSCGPHEGNTRVAIQGSNFTGASAVNFDTYEGINLEVKNDGLIYVTTPAVTETVDSTKVTVVFPDPNKNSIDVGTFFYYTLSRADNGELVVEGSSSGFKGLTSVEVGARLIKDYDLQNDGRHLIVHGVHPDGARGQSANVALVYEANTPMNHYIVGTINVRE